MTVLNASLETDYYWTQNPAPDPTTDLTTAQSNVGRVFPQAYAVVSYPFVRPMSYADLVVEPIVSAVVSPAHTANQTIPNEDSQDIELNWGNLFAGNQYPGIDRLEDGSRITYGIKTSLTNLGTGEASVFLGQTYRISGDNVLPPNSGLQTRFSDYVGQIDINPGKYIDINYQFEWSNDLTHDRMQEINFRLGPGRFRCLRNLSFHQRGRSAEFRGVRKERIDARDLLQIHRSLAGIRGGNHGADPAARGPALFVKRRLYRRLLGLHAHDFARSDAADRGTSGTAVSLQFSLKDLGVFNSPSVH